MSISSYLFHSHPSSGLGITARVSFVLLAPKVHCAHTARVIFLKHSSDYITHMLKTLQRSLFIRIQSKLFAMTLGHIVADPVFIFSLSSSSCPLPYGPFCVCQTQIYFCQSLCVSCCILWACSSCAFSYQSLLSPKVTSERPFLTPLARVASSHTIIISCCFFFLPLQYSCLENPMDGGAWYAAVHGVAESCTQLSDFTFTFYFHALEKEMAAHSGVLAWRIPGTAEPGGLPSMGSQRVRHD